ncbi:L-2-hydroxyglutarate oxidase [Methylomonas sp. MO1]|uniref:L-2-hydroxyglutarate oxidase n=1 Tax=Methylomonas sp. MO1 TaxID=3073619 RepID=UPI0028A50B3D|nr:L-2-hydroxyglutarate oxidase [Methylomonas sp. MO1]MDT4288952.1 L-2-hydroxyglutarate oxidase [Methylomonas sp. MO1]
MTTFSDFCIIGGGIVGFATALTLQERHPDARILLLEKEEMPGRHQTGHNSGVIHAGIYYEPGSLKARLCREGLVATKDFCRAHGIPYDECGKLIVATDGVEHERINTLYDRAFANGLQLERLDGAELARSEPNIRGVAALYSRETAIVDYGLVCRKMAEQVVQGGAVVRFGLQVDRIEESAHYVEVGGGGELFRAGQLIVCGGLQADRLARLAGLDVDFRIVPFRGEYFQLPQSKNAVVNHLIYPAPDPALPFLGIHLTRMIDGSVTVGPNAVIGFAREGYPKLSFSRRDCADFLGFSGFWKLIYRYRHHALQELVTSLSKRVYLRKCRKYCPSLSVEDLLPFRAGIRAQVVTDEGLAVHDFLFKQTERMLHVCNAPSPAATSALPIGRIIAERCQAI